MADDKQWASKYLLDPLLAPQPSEETGPGAHHTPRLNGASGAPKPRSSLSQALPMDGSIHDASPRTSHPTPPESASPRRNPFRDSSVPSVTVPAEFHVDPRRRRGTADRHSAVAPAVNLSERRRATSLSAPFPSDQSQRPLDIIRRESKRAHRAPHLRRGHIPGPDLIDRLDNVLGSYHHEGPYDATLLARNKSPATSPLQAVRSTNQEALKATPIEKVKDSVERHRPLDGVAALSPGMRDVSGRRMEYEEGPNLMVEEGGNYKRWPGMEYHPDDIKGKGEPSYSIEKMLKEHRSKAGRRVSDADAGYEMTSRARPSSVHGSEKFPSGSTKIAHVDGPNGVHRRNTTGRSFGMGLRKRLGSLSLKGR